MDTDSAFMSLLINYIFKNFDVKIKTIAPYNHQSLQAQHDIKVFIYNINLAFGRFRSDVAKILIISNVCI